jgi:hypothetical protein
VKKILTPVLLLLSTFSFAQQVIPVYPPAGGFHIDGNLRANTPTANVGDWLTGPGGSGGFVMDDGGIVNDTTTTTHFVDPYLSVDDIFFGGKYNQDPNIFWSWGIGSASNKIDLNNVLIHFANDTLDCHTRMMFAADRFSNSGLAYTDFEFLQNTLTKNAGGTFSSSGPNGGRTVNDLLFTVEFTGVGQQAYFYFYSWQQISPGVYTWVSFTPPASDSYAFTSAGGENVPYGAFGNTSYLANQFVEGAVDLNHVIFSYINFPGSITFKTLFIKTKASSTPSSPLGDFVPPKQLNNFTLGCLIGIEENEMKSGIKIFPNPAHDNFTITLNQQINNGELKIYDVTGRVVHEQTIINQESEIINYHLSAGIYFVKVRDGEKAYTQKLVIE